MLDHRQQRAGSNRGVRATREEAVREPVCADRQVGVWKRVPLVTQIDAVSTDEREWVAEGYIEA